MPDSLKYQLADKAIPTPGMPEWFFAVLLFVIAISIVGVILGSKYIDRKFPKQQPQPPEDDVEYARRHAGQVTDDPADLTKLLELHFKSLEKLLDEKIDSVKVSNDLQFKMLEQRVAQNQTMEDQRLARLEKTVTDGFRSVNKRIDKHLEAHGTGEEN